MYYTTPNCSIFLMFLDIIGIFQIENVLLMLLDCIRNLCMLSYLNISALPQMTTTGIYQTLKQNKTNQR